MDIRRFRLKNKLSFEGLRHHFVPSSRPKSSSSSSQYTLVSHTSYSPTWATTSFANKDHHHHQDQHEQQEQQPTEADSQTLYEIDPATGEYCEMSFSRNIAAKHFKNLISNRNSVSKDSRTEQQRQYEQQTSHYLESSPRSKHSHPGSAEANGVYGGDAAGEPLIDDTNPEHIIPNSARPLISKFVEDPMGQQQQPQAQQPAAAAQQAQQAQLHSQLSPKSQQHTFERPRSPRSRSASPVRPISKHFQDYDHDDADDADDLVLEPLDAADPSDQRMDSPLAKIEHNTHSSSSNDAAAATQQRIKASVGSAGSLSTAVSRRPASSSIDSMMSADMDHTPHAGLVPLQARTQNEDVDRLQPVLEDDPASFNLVAPAGEDAKVFSLERRSEEMLSGAHLEEIFADASTLLKFTRFLSQHRPQSIPLLIYYLDAKKAIKAIKYANAIAESLSPIHGLDFTSNAVTQTANRVLEQRAKDSFDALVQEDLPAYVAQVFIGIVNLSLRCRVTGTMPSHLREASEGLAEVFCLTDPSRKDNPIVFTSEEFHRTTQYGVDYAIGRNCRFLQGPVTSRHSIRRLKEACEAGRECVEVFLNYRRDGSPFMNLLMVAPLIDSRGHVRYFIGAQVDVTGLCKDATDLEGLRRLVEKKKKAHEDGDHVNGTRTPEKPSTSVSELQELSEMFSETEIEVVRRHGGRMHPDKVEDDESIVHHRPRLHVRDPSTEEKEDDEAVPEHYTSPTRGRLLHVYQNYLLVRPAPSLRILFASPALRTPGMLQSPFLSRIGGSQRVREELQAALSTGRGVTAKIRWVSGRSADEDGRARWVHCTPLLGANGVVGVWMVVIVDEEGYAPVKRFKNAPPVSSMINGKERDRQSSRFTSVNGSLESLGLGKDDYGHLLNGNGHSNGHGNGNGNGSSRSTSRAVSHQLDLNDM